MAKMTTQDDENYFATRLKNLANDVKSHNAQVQSSERDSGVRDYEEDVKRRFVEEVEQVRAMHGEGRIDVKGLNRDLESLLTYANNAGKIYTDDDENRYTDYDDNNLRGGSLYRSIVNRPVLATIATLAATAATALVTEAVFQYDRITSYSSALNNWNSNRKGWIDYFATRIGQSFFYDVFNKGFKSYYWPLMLFPLVPVLAVGTFIAYKSSKLRKKVDFKERALETYIQETIWSAAKSISAKIDSNNFTGQLSEKEFRERVSESKVKKKR